MQREPLKDKAAGKWRGILPAIGIDAKALRNRHGPCPMCGGKDRFRFDDKGGRGTWICNQCGAGDGIELVKKFRGVDFKEAARIIEQHIGAAPVIGSNGQLRQTDAKKREEMNALWKRSRAIDADDPAGRYLAARTGITTYPACLRFAPDERYTEPGARATWRPVMLAKVDPSDAAAAEGATAALHRTYLTPDGHKADVSSPRKMMGAMPPGAAVRLMPHESVLGIAEGIETAMSASALYGVPCWAALNAGLLQDWNPPAGVTTVWVFGDNDANSTGQAAAYALAHRLNARGISSLVEIPQTPGTDWNDVQRQRSG